MKDKNKLDEIIIKEKTQKNQTNAGMMLQALDDVKVKKALTTIISNAILTNSKRVDTKKVSNSKPVLSLSMLPKKTSNDTKKPVVKRTNNLFDLKNRFNLGKKQAKIDNDATDTNKVKDIIGKDLEKNKKSKASNTYVLAKELVLNGDATVMVNGGSGLFKTASDYKTRQSNKKEQERQEKILSFLGGLVDTTKKMSKALSMMSLFNMVKMLPAALGILGGVALVTKGLKWLEDHGIVDLKTAIESFFTGVSDIIKGGLDWCKEKLLPTMAKILAFVGDLAGKAVDTVAGAVTKEWRNEVSNKNDNLENTLVLGTESPQSVINSALGNGPMFQSDEQLLFKDNKFNLGQAREFKDIQGGKVFSENRISDMVKQGVVSKSTGKLINKWALQQRKLKTGGIVTGYTSSAGATKVSFPVPVFILDAEPSTVAGGGLDIVVQRADTAMGNTLLIVSGLIKLYVPLGVWIPKDTMIGFLGPNGTIVGDQKEFFKNEDFSKYINTNQFKVESSVNYETFAQDPKFKDRMSATRQHLQDKGAREEQLSEFLSHPVQSIKDSRFARNVKKYVKEETSVHEVNKSGVSDNNKPKSTVSDQNKNVQIGLNNAAQLKADKNSSGMKMTSSKSPTFDPSTLYSGNSIKNTTLFCNPNQDGTAQYSKMTTLAQK